MKLLLPLLLASAAALGQVAQLKLYALGDNGSETEAAGVYDFGSTGPGDLLDVRFRIRNTGTAAATVQTITAAGQGFTVAPPSLPLLVAPGGSFDFRVRFSGAGSGSYSANLTVNSLSLLLRATVTAAAFLTAEGEGSARTDIPAGTAIYLGRAQKGQTASKALWLENRGRDPLSIRALAASGVGFAYRGPALPIAIAPGAAQRIDLDFTPPAARTYTGTLTIDGRAFPLTGVGFDPPLPKPSIRLEGSTASGQQPKVWIDLASAPESTATGVLKMEFRPLTNTFGDDPGIRFMSSGARSVNVEARPGDSKLWFGNQSSAVFQTGTTAGSILLTLEFDSQTFTQTIEIPPAAPVLDTTLALRKTQDLDISLSGFDNARSITQALFTFYDSAGRPISPGTIRVDVRRDFDEFFRSSSAIAGIFTLRASFPVSGGAASGVAGVEVEIVNSAGSVRTQRISFP